MMHPPRHTCRPKPPGTNYDHPIADMTRLVEMCLKSTHTDRGHCLCWRNEGGPCCDCLAPLPPTIGVRVEAIAIPERVQGEVVEVTRGGYFTVRYDDGSKFKNYAPAQAARFKQLPSVDLSNGDVPNQSTEAYSSCPISDHGP